MSELLLAYYADDLTGATDALEQLACAGVQAALFLEPPDEQALQRLPGLQAIGVAGATRALGEAALEAELRPAFAKLNALRPRHLHYKVCSTFDSSPAHGSIGRALEIAREAFQPRLTAVLGGSPPLGRYCVFGNLFATANVAGGGAAHRLDRHPSASRHPTTPMTESDLRRLLAQQSNLGVELFDVTQWTRAAGEQVACLEQLLADGAEAVLFDALDTTHLESFGALIDHWADGESPVVSIGSSGVETALCRHWSATGTIGQATQWPAAGAGLLLVGSGSCSPVTAAQIDWAVGHGFGEVALDAPALLAGDDDAVITQATEQATAHLRGGRNVVVHLAKGPNDERIRSTRRLAEAKSHPGGGTGDEVTAVLGRSLGRLIDQCLQQTATSRVCLAGGDTSSFAARELGIQALELASPASPGAPWCRAWAPGRDADQIEFNFKGGQVGTEAFFGLLASGQN
ncbi:MAG: four-carbon acid sugar kinase family protein [Planctomycetales bacterium]|nr:four-carbon acid sugar kinase family protein [Planctomycetales bacterium]